MMMDVKCLMGNCKMKIDFNYPFEWVIGLDWIVN